MTAQVLSVLLADIDRPDGWDEDLDTGRVTEIAADISERRQTITPIGVRDMGDGRHRLIYGRHRLKAHEQAGAREILCLLLAHDSPDEERAQVLAENLHRCTHAGPERRKLIAEYLALKARLPERAIIRHSGGEIEDRVNEPKRGRKKDPDVAAKREAAEAIGVSERTRQRAEKEAAADAPPLVPKPPKIAPIESRIRVLANECEGQRSLITALYEALPETQHEARRLLHKALEVRAALQDALTGAAEAIDAGRAAIRDVGKSSAETRGRTASSRVTSDKSAPYATDWNVPRKGLGGRKLRVEADEPEHDTQGDAFEAAPRPPCAKTTESGAPCGLPLGHENVCDGEAF